MRIDSAHSCKVTSVCVDTGEHVVEFICDDESFVADLKNKVISLHVVDGAFDCHEDEDDIDAHEDGFLTLTDDNTFTAYPVKSKSSKKRKSATRKKK